VADMGRKANMPRNHRLASIEADEERRVTLVLPQSTGTKLANTGYRIS
jgi:hypothetical protein